MRQHTFSAFRRQTQAPRMTFSGQLRPTQGNLFSGELLSQHLQEAVGFNCGYRDCLHSLLLLPKRKATKQQNTCPFVFQCWSGQKRDLCKSRPPTQVLPRCPEAVQDSMQKQTTRHKLRLVRFFSGMKFRDINLNRPGD